MRSTAVEDAQIVYRDYILRSRMTDFLHLRIMLKTRLGVDTKVDFMQNRKN